MFDNIGGKIKTLAKVICWIGIIACIIIGIILMSTDRRLVLSGILTATLGSLLSWVSSFVLYGFGELVENSKVIREKLTNQKTTLSKQKSTETKVPKNEEYINIETPFVINGLSNSDDGDLLSSENFIDIKCPHCNEMLTFTEQMLKSNDKLTCPLCDQTFAIQK